MAGRAMAKWMGVVEQDSRPRRPSRRHMDDSSRVRRYGGSGRRDSGVVLAPEIVELEDDSSARRRYSDLRKELEVYEEEQGLGTISFSAIQSTLETLSDLPAIPRVKNLYSITLPAGCGKTYLSNKYGILDIDSCATPTSRGYIAQALSMVYDGSDSLKADAKEWFDSVRHTISCMTFTQRTLVVTHDDLTAYMIGASKIGDFNLSVETKKLVDPKLDKTRIKLIEINDSVFRKMNHEEELESHAEVEEAVLALCRKWDIHTSESSCIRRDMTEEKVAKMSIKECVAAQEAGILTKACLDKIVTERREFERYGYGTHIGAWAMAISSGFGLQGEGKKSIPDDVDLFRKRFKYEKRRDVCKIMQGASCPKDGLKRVTWWEAVGIKSGKKQMYFQLLVHLKSGEIERFMKCAKMLLERGSGFMCEVLSDEERMEFLQLIAMYVEVDDLIKIRRHEKIRGGSEMHKLALRKPVHWLSETQTDVASLILFEETMPDKTSIEHVISGLVSWDTSQGLAVACVLNRYKEVSQRFRRDDHAFRQVLMAQVEADMNIVENIGLKNFKELLERPIQRTAGLFEEIVLAGQERLISMVADVEVYGRESLEELYDALAGKLCGVNPIIDGLYLTSPRESLGRR